MDWFERLNRLYQVVVIMVFGLGLLGTFMGAAAAVSVRILDAMVSAQVQPVRDMVEFELNASGRWSDYLRFQEQKERERKAFESRRAAGLPTEIWKRSN
jgi:hypothetical protein